MHRLRLAVHQAFGLGKIARALALDHIGRQGPRTAGEADQRYLPVQLATDQAHRIHHVAQFLLRVRHREVLDRLQRADRLAKPRALAGLEVQPQPHRIRDSQDVGEQDRGVQREPAQWLHGDFAGQLRVLAKAHEAAGLGTGLAVFRQIATGLAHDPDRRTVHRLAQLGPQETIVFQAIGHRKAQTPRYSRMPSAASRPSKTAVTTRSEPRTMSPPANTFGLPVWKACSPAVCTRPPSSIPIL